MKHRTAFSLVELSIVLVILGLLTGGILAGRSLIRASELRAVGTEYQRYVTATHAFKDKYFALPGDMPNAVAFWGAQAGGTANGQDATCAALTTAATGVATCNGNGNGLVNDGTYEMFRYWQHLANAGLIEGQYGGVAGSGGNYHHQLGINSPRSKLANAGFGMRTVVSVTTGSAFSWAGHLYGHHFRYGKETTDNLPYSAVLKPEEAWNIDTKLDDGSPYFGKIMSFPWGNCTTALANNETAALYDLDNSNVVCGFTFSRII